MKLGLDKVKNTGETQDRTERRDAAENRQRILDAALRLFEQHGVEQVSKAEPPFADTKRSDETLLRRYRSLSSHK